MSAVDASGIRWRCKLRKVKTSDRTKGMSLRVLDGGDYLSDVVQAGSGK